MVAKSPMFIEHEKTKGVKLLFSTSLTRFCIIHSFLIAQALHAHLYNIEKVKQNCKYEQKL